MSTLRIPDAQNPSEAQNPALSSEAFLLFYAACIRHNFFFFSLAVFASEIRAGRIVGIPPFQAATTTTSRRGTYKVRKKNLQGLPITGASAVVRLAKSVRILFSGKKYWPRSTPVAP